MARLIDLHWMGAAAHRSSFEGLLDDLDVDLT